jgi:hypothetical protein
MARFNLNPRSLLVRTRFNYEKLPGADANARSNSPIFDHPYIKSFKHRNPWANRIQRPRFSLVRVLTLILATFVITTFVSVGVYKRHVRSRDRGPGVEKKLYHWEHYPR